MSSRNPYSHLEIESLPRLPVPPLEHTLSFYLELLEPLLTPEHFQDVKQKVAAFAEGEGKVLDQELRQVADAASTSWLEGFWETMYLAYRGEPPINTNPCFTFSPTPDMSQLGRTSQFVEAIVIYWKLLQKNLIPHDKGEKDAPLCMTQYGRVFATARVPVSGRDKVFSYTDSKHIVVLHRRRFYSLNVLTEDDKLIPASVISQGLQDILNQTPEVRGSGLLVDTEVSDGIAEGGLGIMTATDRDVWASLRGKLLANHHNRRLIDLIDRAIVVIALDDESPNSPEAIINQFLHANDGTNRWFDKLQLISAPNGEISWNMEHAPFDGHSLLTISGYLWDHVRGAKKFNTESLEFASSASPASLKIEALDFAISRKLRETMISSWEGFRRLIAQTELCVLRFSDFGADYIKKQGLSPDAFVQMAYQLAYYKLTNTVASTYESCMTKRFYHGRTECVRSVSRESKQMCTVLANTAASSRLPVTDKYQLLKDATERHVKTMNLCKVARGVDRHLWGMQQLALQKRDRVAFYEVPDIYLDSSFPTFCTSVLSTSNCGGNAFQLFAFGPVTGNGLGLGYMIKNNNIDICISSFMGHARAFRSCLVETFAQLRSICDQRAAATATAAAVTSPSSSPKAKL
eukprot:TRINITY_DN1501_c0_g1_i1.p1 TRINITY_DN1501_c0_g1~~TRINITY_DN1501_c0_g1_i1.p1  ORF type:complete len:678 (+),score=310.96 TRINITY_DN1501_c0_g1_i1:137-2035(+)